MYENLTVEDIKKDIINSISTDISTNEGTFLNNVISAVSYKIWQLYQSLDAIVPIAYVDETSGDYIDKRCNEFGITRKAGTKATVTLNFTGIDRSVIPKGKVFLTSDGYEFETNADVTISSGIASVTATAIDVGSIYNVNINSITLQLVNLYGLNTVTNSQAASGGTDAETDEELVKRFYAYLQSYATSGNSTQYKQWALEVNGVSNAKVIPLWNGAGTVKILIVGANNSPVDASVIQDCKDYIETQRPIGATVTIESAQGLNINVSATIVINTDITSISVVKSAFESAIGAYLKSISFVNYTVVYNRIASILLNIDGVIDFTSLTINGVSTNITLSDNQVPLIGTVEVGV